MNQHTVKHSIKLKGQGLHSGLPVTVAIEPLAPSAGIQFVRSDIPHARPMHAVLENVNEQKSQGRQTSIGTNGATICTIEHLMAAFHGLGIDNALVQVSSEELPGLDGSAREYVEALHTAGASEQPAPREYFVIQDSIIVPCGQSTITVLPFDGLRVTYHLRYDSQDVEEQSIATTVTPEIFATDLAVARTFCLKQEALALLQQGWGKGASYKNTLVFEKNRPIGNTLRFTNEAARHKAMDLIGDLYLLGKPIQGAFIAERSGHANNLAVVRRFASMQRKNNTQSTQLSQNSSGQPLDLQDIKKIIPHRPPFLFVDRLQELIPGKRAIGYKRLSQNEDFFRGHFPGHPIMPGVLIIEALAQVGGAIMLSVPGNHGKLAYFMSIDQAKFRAPVFPGDEVRLEVEVVKARSKTGQCVGKAFVGDKLVCEASVKFAVVDKTS